MPLVNAKCTSCGATLEVDPSKDAAVCQYCGSAFIVEKAINNYNITNNVTNNIQAENVTIINQTEKNDFEIVAGKLINYRGASRDIVVPEGVTSIEKGAIPDGVRTITLPKGCGFMAEACKSSDSIIGIIISKDCESIPMFSFYGIPNPVAFEIPESVTSIGMEAFASCTKLLSITLPNGLKHIGSSAFEDCPKLEKVTMPSSVTTIDQKAFANCTSLTSIRIPISVETIGNSAFADCSNLSNVEIIGTPKMAPLGSVDYPFRGTPFEEKMKAQQSQQPKRSQQSKKSGGCYVATCVYGSYDCPEVWTLRRYRDNTLAETWYGRAFIHTYYAVSPTIVKLFGETEWFKKMWRGRLDRMVADLQAKGVESTPYKDKKW